MKSIIPLSAIVLLAALALMGCDQNTPSSSTGTQSTNSSIPGSSTNTPPNVNTNMPTGTK
jgi:ABC-type oligopeptide transport system substrate-binding subunit